MAYEKCPVINENDTTDSAGNGAIMRLAPIVIANHDDLENAVRMAILSCRETHNSIIAEAITGLFATALYDAMHRMDKKDIVKKFSRVLPPEYDEVWLETMDTIILRAVNKDEKPLINLGGYIVDTITIALWGLYNYDSFKDGMMAVIRLGGDTDTNAACYGQLAGAYYGYKTIPEEWRKNVYKNDELVEIADTLYNIDKCPIIKTRFADDKNYKEPK